MMWGGGWEAPTQIQYIKLSFHTLNGLLINIIHPLN